MVNAVPYLMKDAATSCYDAIIFLELFKRYSAFGKFTEIDSEDCSMLSRKIFNN